MRERMTCKEQSVVLLVAMVAILCHGCRVAVIDRGRNIIDGVPILGSDVCCPPEDYPAAGCRCGKCDRRRYAPQQVQGDPCCACLESWHAGPDCDGRWLVLERLIGKRRLYHCSPVSFSPACSACQPGQYTQARGRCYDNQILANAILFLVVDKTVTLDGLRVADSDIIAFDGQGYSVLLDGSDIGLEEIEISAFAVLNENQIVISFAKDFEIDAEHALPGLSGRIDNSDLVLFTANSWGPITRGTFQLLFDGSDVGLDAESENIDAVEVTSDMSLVISTSGKAKVTKVDGDDEDLLYFVPNSLGDNTDGSWELYFDGSDVDMDTDSSENINAVAFDQQGQMFFSTEGRFASGQVIAGATDVSIFTPTRLGKKTIGSFSYGPIVLGHGKGISRNDIIAIDIPGEASVVLPVRQKEKKLGKEKKSKKTKSTQDDE